MPIPQGQSWCGWRKIAEEADFILMRNADKATLLNTELIPLSATKNAGGVQVFTLKKNSAVTAVFAKAEFETEEYEYYRTKKSPQRGILYRKRIKPPIICGQDGVGGMEERK